MKLTKDKDEVIHSEDVMDRLGGDEELLIELWQIYISDTPKQLEILKQAIEINDIVLIERQAHSLKSASANIGAEQAREKAFEIEVSARNTDLSNIYMLYEELRHEIEKAIMALADQELLKSFFV